MQLKFNFEGKPETEFLLDELALTNHRLDNLRRGIFARFTKLEKEFMQFKEEHGRKKENKVVEMPLIDLLENLQKGCNDG